MYESPVVQTAGKASDLIQGCGVGDLDPDNITRQPECMIATNIEQQ